MAKKKELKGDMLWSGIDDSAFYNEDIYDEDIGEFNLEKEKIYMANVNHSRQIIKLMDGLKPPSRRLLSTMYEKKLFPEKTPQKSAVIVSDCMKTHVHGDTSLYQSMVIMAQPFKNMIPLVKGIGNFGNAARPDFYGASRYTEATMSKYAKECFFDDYDPDCVDMIQSSLLAWQPMQLPAKFPNILLNGSVGLAVGNRLGIPPYHPEDVYKMCKKLMEDPDAKGVIWAYPEIPTGCDIVDNGNDYKEMCKDGKGVLRMRSRIEIEETKDAFILHVLNIPWLISLDKVHHKIIELIKQNKVSIKNIQDESAAYVDKSSGEIRTRIDYQIFISKSQDPYAIKNFLYKNTDLAYSLSIQFKVATEDFKITNLSMRELILAWLDERREYKRRLYNKKITKNKARISLLNILLELLDEKNINKTMKIIRNNNKSDIVVSLVKDYGMNSYQASKIADMSLSTFSKDARKRFTEELEDVTKETNKLMKVVKSPKKIDEIILEELGDMKKYAKPRLCRIVNPADDQIISDRMHTIVITKQKYIKKLPENLKRGIGSLNQGDYAIRLFKSNNLSKLLLIDSNGRYSIIPVSDIPNSETNSVGTKIFDICKLDGEIVEATCIADDFDNLTPDDLKSFVILTLSERGIIKKTPISEFNFSTPAKNLKLAKLKDGDMLVSSMLTMNSNNVLMVSQKGNYSYTRVNVIPESSKDSQGVIGINLPENDSCSSMCTIIPKSCKSLVLITEKGKVKKLSVASMGSVKARRSTSYIAKVDPKDKIISILAFNDSNMGINVLGSNGNNYTIVVDDLPETTRITGFKKMIPVSSVNNIIDIQTFAIQS